MGLIDIEDLVEIANEADLKKWLDKQLQGSISAGIKEQIIEMYVKPKVVEFLNHEECQIWGLEWEDIEPLLDFDVAQLTTTSIQAMLKHPLSLAFTHAKTVAPKLLIALLEGWNRGEAKNKMTHELKLVGIDWDNFIRVVPKLFDAVWWTQTRKETVKKLEDANEEVKHEFDEVVQKLIDLAEKFAEDPAKFLVEHLDRFIQDGLLSTE
jgi:hypothetical protein